MGNDDPRDFLDNFSITAYTCYNNHTTAWILVRASFTATGLSVDFHKIVSIATLFFLSQKSSLDQALFKYRTNVELFGGVKVF